MKDRLHELVARYGLGAPAQAALQALLDLVASDPAAPTTVTEPARAVDVHLADSLVGLEVEAIAGASRLIDLGAGAGFPGLALAAARPGLAVTELESVGKKVAFMERAIVAADLPNARALHGRAEEHDERYDVVTARALASLDVLAEYAAPLLELGGTLVAWKGARDPQEEAAGDRAAALLGLELVDAKRVRPYEGVDQRHLYLYSKVGPTPDRYPRRPGMARKRPLGGSTAG